ncbi:hypothetical protein [Salinibacterium sp. ZJ450]|uniref:hypothetical protein n=1 Tax=Salinibacterium sp. ZJ450 TaxID=2708338 RepID=UPI0014237E16|nr:hypothetical protein [Salinibacterium sp. ZJ450]
MRSSAGSFSFTVDALGSTILLTDSTQARASTPTTPTTTAGQAANNPWQYRRLESRRDRVDEIRGPVLRPGDRPIHPGKY